MARLLLVDDDPDQIKLWRLVLETAGHQIEVAETLPHAISKLSGAPDILLMDLWLPDLKNGLELIRTASGQKSTRIVVLSGWPQDLEGRPEAKLVDRVIAKPVNPPTLLRLIVELARP